MRGEWLLMWWGLWTTSSNSGLTNKIWGVQNTIKGMNRYETLLAPSDFHSRAEFISKIFAVNNAQPEEEHFSTWSGLLSKMVDWRGQEECPTTFFCSPHSINFLFLHAWFTGLCQWVREEWNKPFCQGYILSSA